MTYPSRLLTSPPVTTSPPATTSSPSDTADPVDSDFVVILAALLCALICVLGLVAVARCAWLRRFSSSSAAAASPPSPANKGLKKKVLRSLPKLSYSADLHAPKLLECAICLSEFADGDDIRILPHCGHGFHVACIDTWLGSHSSCPSCRQILAVARCDKCGGGLPEAEVTAPATVTSSSSAVSCPADRHVNSFLP